MSRTEQPYVSDRVLGLAETEAAPGTDLGRGLDASPTTNTLILVAANHEDIIKTRTAMGLRGMSPLEDGLKKLEAQSSRLVSKALRNHELWPWLSQYPGLGGYHTARLIGYLREPSRFKGPRSVWHYCGLHVVDGRSPRRARGQKCDWNPKARTAVLQPGGIAEQIVRLRVPVYRDQYDETKERLQRERGTDGSPLASSGAEGPAAFDRRRGPGDLEGPEVVRELATEAAHGLRPFQIDAIARKVAAKAFVADMWRAWLEVGDE